MTEKPPHPGYARAMEAARELSGKDRGAATWLATAIGASRQILFHWSKLGFPEEVVGRVSKVTGVPKDDVSKITIDTTPAVWAKICKKLPQSLIDQTVIRNRE